MAEDLVTAARIAAGREYLDALIGLGFDPEGAMWSVREGEADTLELSLFSSVVDRIGPRAVYDALFAAYDKALTPRDFDPWQVSVYSPGMDFYEVVTQSIPKEKNPDPHSIKAEYVMGEGRLDFDGNDRVVAHTFDGAKRLTFRGWVYRNPRAKKQSAVPQMKAWHRFEERLAQAA